MGDWKLAPRIFELSTRWTRGDDKISSRFALGDETQNLSEHFYSLKLLTRIVVTILNPSSRHLFETRRFGNWIMSTSSSGTCSVGPNR
jgi:hypothetical protein